MEFEELDISQLLKTFFYAVIPIVLFCLAGIGIAWALVKSSRAKALQQEEEEKRVRELREKQKIERMSEYYRRLKEKEKNSPDTEA